MVAHLDLKELVVVLLCAGDSRLISSVFSVVYDSHTGGEVRMTSSFTVYQWSQNLVLSLLMPVKVNCSSAWTNRTAGQLAQNSGSRTVTLDISSVGKLTVVSILRWGHQYGMSVPVFEETTM